LVAADVVHVPANGPRQRLIEARDLGTAVLLRTQSSTLLAQAADIDPLTQLPNRPAFYQACDASSTDTERFILHLDLDGLKAVNHEMGPAAGDAVLRVVADRIRIACGAQSVLGRIGDDEFAILQSVPNGRSLDIEPESLAKALLHVVADPVIVAGRGISVSASIGLARCSVGTATDQLLIWAEAAMHDAKQAGGNRIRKFSMTFG
jgi:diguanylate cyclase (GGDEF)-like protein